MITVRDILAKKPTIYNSIEPSALTIDALTMLSSVNLSYLIVKENDSYKGLFCERDYCRNVILKGRSSRDTPVKEVMTVDVPIVQLSDTAEYCMNVMNLNKTRYLLAYDDEEFMGVITIHDLLREVLLHGERVLNVTVAKKLIDINERPPRVY